MQQLLMGTVIDPELSDEIKVTVVATGLDKPQEVSPPCDGKRMKKG